MKFERKMRRLALQKAGRGRKILQATMASLIAMQSFTPVLAASQITRVDGMPVEFKDGVADVYAEKVYGNNDVGINRFTDFSIADKNTANMYFKEAGGTTEVTNLVNFVANKIDVAGTVNALRESAVGGNLYFVSPQGMVVSSTGVINAGSLTIMTPTNDFYEKFKLNPADTSEKAQTVNIFSADLTQDQLATLLQNYKVDTLVPATMALNESGSIVVEGQINVKTAAMLMAQSVKVGNDGVVRNWMDFTKISNVGAADQKGLSDSDHLTLVSDGTGSISLVGVSDVTVDGKVEAANGTATIKAENEVTVDLSKLDEKKAALVDWDAAASGAKVTINGTVKGETVDISAKSTATFKGNVINAPAAEKKDDKDSGSSSDTSGDASKDTGDKKDKTETITTGIKKTGAAKKISDTAKKLFDKVNVLMDVSAASAEVEIGQKAKVASTKDNVSISANAAVKNDLSLTIQPKVVKKDGDKESKKDDVTTSYFMGGSIYNGSVGAAAVTILGDVTATKDLTISADASNSTKAATTIKKADAPDQTAYMNAIVNVVSQETAAVVTLGTDGVTPTISAGGALKVGATTDTSLDVSAKIATDNKAVASTAINLVGTDTNASIGVNTKLSGATVSTNAKNTVSQLNITTDNAYEKTGADDSASGGASGGDASGGASGGDASGGASGGDTSGGTSGDASAADTPVEEKTVEAEAEAPAADGDTSIADALKALLGSDEDSEKEESGVLAANKDADEKAAATSGDTDAVKAEKGTTATDTEKQTEMKGDGDTAEAQKQSSEEKEKKEEEKKKTGWNDYVDIGASVMVGNFKNAATVDIGSAGSIESTGAATVTADVETEKSAINTVNTLLNTNTDTKAVVSAAVAIKNMKNGAAVILSGSDAKRDVISAGGDVKIAANVVDQPAAEKDDKQEATMVTQAFVATDVGDEGATVIPFGATGTVGIEKTTGNANVYVGKNTKITSGGETAVESNVSGQDIMQAGKEVVKKDDSKKDDSSTEGGSSESGGSGDGKTDDSAQKNDANSDPTSSGNKVGLGGTVAVQNRYMNGKVEVASGVEIDAGKISVSSQNDTTAGASALGGSKTSNVGITGMVSYMGGESNARVLIDSGATLKASVKGEGKTATDGTILITSANTSTIVNKAGLTDISKSTTIGAAVGVVSYDVLTETKVKNLTGATQTAGTFSATAFTASASNTSTIKNSTVAGVSSGDEKKPDEKKDTESQDSAGGAALKVRDEKTEEGGDSSEKAVELSKLSVSSEGKKEEATVTDPSAPSETDTEVAKDSDGNADTQSDEKTDAQKKANSTVNIAAAGSVSWNDVKTSAISEMSGIKVTGVGDAAAVSVAAKDTSSIAADSGATALIKEGKEDETTKFGATLAGGVAGNDVLKTTRATMDGVTLQNMASVSNSATNSGTQQATGMSVGTGQKAGKGFSAVASASVNYATNRVAAEMKNVTAGGVVTNMAMDNDIQIAGGLSKAKTMQTVGAGAAVAINKVKNDISALISGGTYGSETALAVVTNAALSDLTQIGGAASIGIAEGKDAYLGLNAAVAVNTVKNNLAATIENATIYGAAVTNMAQDGMAPGSEAQAQLVGAIKEMVKEAQTQLVDSIKKKVDEGFDALANDTAATVGQEVGLKTDANGDPTTTGEAEDNKESQVDYNVGDYVGLAKTLTNVGNVISTGAFSLSAKSNYSAAAAVSYANIQNDIKANISGSTITANKVSTQSTTDTVMIDAAIGSAYSGDAKGIAAAGSVALSKINNTTEATIADSTITVISVPGEGEGAVPTPGSVTAAASNKSFLITAAGEAGISKGYAAAGMGWAQNTLGNTTIAKVLGSTISAADATTGLDLSVTAGNTSKVYAVGAGLEVGIGGKGANIDGAFAGNTGTNSTQAIVDKSDKNTKNKIQNAKNVAVSAESKTTQKAVAGNIGAGTKTVAVGGAVAINKLGSSDNHQSVTAALNESDVTTVNASTVSVSAKDEDSLLTIGAGGAVKAGGGVGVSGQGSVAISRLYKDSKVYMTNTAVDSNSETRKATISLSAESTGDITGSAAAMTVSAGGSVAVGGAAGVSLVTLSGDTEAVMTGGSKVAKDVAVRAKSERKILNVGVGLGVSASSKAAVSGEANVSVNKLENNVRAGIYSGTVNADNNVVVSAVNSNTLKNYGGGLNVNGSGLASVGLGATVAVNTIGGNMTAEVSGANVNASGKGDAVTVTEYEESSEKGKLTSQTKEKKGLVVTADSKQRLHNVSVTAGIAAAGKVGVSVDATVATNKISGTTSANVKNSNVNSWGTAGDVAVLAHDNTDVDSIVGTMKVSAGAIAGVNAGAAVDTNTFSRNTTATVDYGDNNLTRVTANTLSVRAASEFDVNAIEQDAGVGGGAVGVGVSGVVSVNKYSGTTKAYLAGIIDAGSVDVKANTAKNSSIFTGTYNIAAGAVAVGATAGVITTRDESKTQALIEDAIMTASGDINVAAANTEKIKTDAINANLAIGIGAAVGAAVSVNNVENTVEASINRSQIASGILDYYNSNVAVKATNTTTLATQNAAASAGLASVGVGVAINNIRSGTSASVRESEIYAKSLTVNSLENRTIDVKGIAATVGFVGIGTNVNINNIGTALADSYSYDDGNFSTENIRNTILNGLQTVDNANGTLAASSYAKEAGASKSTNKADQESDAGWKSTNTETKTPGVSATVSDSKMEFTGSVNISGKAETRGDVNLYQGSVGVAGVNVSVGITDIKTNNKLSVTDSKIKASDFNLSAENGGKIEQRVYQGAVGLATANVAVSRLLRSGANAIEISGSTLNAVTSGATSLTAGMNITATESMEMSNNIIGAGVGGVAAGVLLSYVKDGSNNTVSIDNESKLSAVNYTKVTKRVAKTTLSSGTLTTSFSNITDEKPEYRDITIAVNNNSKVSASSKVNSIAAVSGSAAVATAIIGNSDHSAGINKISIGQNNTLEGGTINLFTTNSASASAETGSVSGALVSGTGVVSRAEANGTSEVSIGDKTTLIADMVYARARENMKANADTHGINTGFVGVVVNRAYANLVGKVGIDVGNITFKSHDWEDAHTESTNSNGETQIVRGKDTLSDEGGTLRLAAYDDSSNVATVDSLTVGAVAASGTNEAYTNSDTKININLNADSLSAEALQIAAGSGVTSIGKANGDGGGILNISPVAARAENDAKSDTKIIVSGTYDISGDVLAATANFAQSSLLADAMQVSLAGVGGTIAKNTVNQNAETTFSDAALTVGGKVNIGSENDYNFAPISGQNYIIKGNGYGAASAATASLTNSVTNTAKTNLGSVTSEGAQNYWAVTDNDITSNAYVYSLGIVGSVAVMNNKLNLVSDNTISQKAGTLLKTLSKDSDISMGAADEETISNRAKAENSVGVAGAVVGVTENNITRNNRINAAGQIFSRRDVNLYAGKFYGGEIGTLDLKTDAEVYNRAIIPMSKKPTLSNNFTQNNIVDISGNVESVQDVNLYADAGKEYISQFVGYYTAYGGKGDPTYIAKTNGKLNVDQDGNPSGGNYNTDNHVSVTGSVTAGVAHSQKITIGGDTYEGLVVLTKEQYGYMSAYYQKEGKKIPENYIVVMSDAEYEKLSDTEKANKAYKKISEIIKITDKNGKETDKAGITAADFAIGSYNYASGIQSRLTELTKLIKQYPEGSSAYLGYLAEYNYLVASLVDSGMVAKKGDGTYEFVGELYINYIDLPNMVASGGDIKVQTDNLSGSGTLTANGTPEIIVENNTSLATNVNNIIVSNPGGKLYYNSLSMDSKEAIAAANENKTITIGTLNVTPGESGSITIHGNAQKSATIATNAVKYYVEGEERTVPVVSDIVVSGEVYAKDGTVTIRSQSDDIVVSGKDEKTNKQTAVHGKTVNLIAASGSVTQSYIDGIESIGGSVESQYKDKYTADYAKGDESKKTEGTETVIKVNTDTVQTTGGRIAGANIFINAADVNLNGMVQSGYDNFYVTISSDTKLDNQNHISASGTKTVAQRLEEIEANNVGRNLTNSTVLGNPNYCVITGGETYNSTKQYYEYVVPVYYNPTTKTLLTPDIESKGGNIFINGRISSTGSGKIVCLDGVSDIHIENNLSNNLITGNLVANNVDGVVRIGDTTTRIITEITRGDNGVVNYKTYNMVAGTEIRDSAKDGWDSTYTYLTKNSDQTMAYYNPTTGLRYNWTEGKQVGTTRTYDATWYKKWWGLSSSKSELEEKMRNEEKTEKAPDSGNTNFKQNGTYIGTNSKVNTNDVLDVIDYYRETENTKTIEEERHWSQGFFGCHKYTYIRWKTTQGEEFARTYSVKADQSVPIQFIGAMDGNSTTSVVSKGSIDLSGTVGNVNAYTTSDNGTLVNGNVIIKSKEGDILHSGGSIYGKDVTLEAAGNISKVNITTGDSLTLSAVNTESTKSQNIDITVSTVNGAKGNVNLIGAGLNGTDDPETDTFTLVTKGKEGNITTADSATIYSRRIDLTSENGSISANIKVGKMPINSDTLSASINAQAAKDILLTQKSGDMRIGKVYTNGGNVTLNILDGSVVDALPYGELVTSDESALLQKWRAMGLLGNSDDTMIKEKTAVNAKAGLSAYEQWDEKALLYTIEDSIINPTSDTLPSTSNKAPNVKGNNITINVKNNAGLDSEKTTIINSKEFTDVEKLKTISRADASTVTIEKKTDNTVDFIINEKLPIGVQTNTAEGKLTIGKIAESTVDKSEGHVYVQVRTESKAASENKDLTINAIKATGDVSLAGLGNIYYNGDAQTAAIVAKSLYIASGANSSVGTVDHAITTDLAADGNLRAIGVGVYIDNVGNNNLAVKSASSGADIVISATKDIVMADEDTGSGDALGRIQVENDGSNITLVSREGSVGTVQNNADGTIEYDENGKPKMKGVRVRNSETGKGLLTVKAAKDVAIDGVTNAADGTTPGGVLHIAVSGSKAGTNLNNIGLRANGTLQIDGNLTAEETVRIESKQDLTLDNDIIAKKELYIGGKNVTQEAKDINSNNLKIAADENITLKGNGIKADNNVTLAAGKAIDAAETIKAGNDVSMTAATTLDVSKIVTATKGNITTVSGDTTTVSADMTAGTDLSMKSEKDIKVTADLTATNGNITTESTGDTDISGTVTAKAGKVTTTSTGDTTISGNVTAGTDVSVTGQNVTHDTGMISGVNVTVDGKKAVDFKGTGITATTEAVLKAGTSMNVAETVAAGNNVSMNAGTTLNIAKIVTATQNITTESGDTTTVSAKLTAGKDLSMKSGKDIKATADLTATAGNVTTESTGDTDISGNVTATAGNVTTTSTGDTTISGTVKAAQNVSLTGANLTHDKGTISGANVTVEGKEAVDLKGNGITADNDVALKAGTSLNVAETVTAGNDVSMNAGTTLTVSKMVTASQNITTESGDTTTVSADMTAGKDLSLKSGKDIKATADLTAKAGNVTTESKGDTAISGNVTAMAGNVTTTSTGDTTISGNVKAAQNVSLTGANLTHDKGTIVGANVTVEGKEAVDLKGDGITTTTDAALKAGTSLNVAETVTVGNDVSMNAGTTLNIAKIVTATQNITTESGDTTTVSANMTAGKDLSVKSGKDIKATADLTATNGNITTESTGDTDISGNVTAMAGNVTTTSTGDTTISGNVKAAQNVSLTGANLTHDKGTIDGVNVTVEGKKAVDLKGDGITADTDAALKAGTSLNVAETVTAGNDVSMNAGTTLTISKIVTATQNITTESGDTTTVSADMTAGKDLSMKSGKDINVAADLTAQAGNVTTESTGDTAISGNMTAKDTVSVSGNNVTQNSDAISGNTVTLGAKKAVTLAGGSVSGDTVKVSAGTDLLQNEAHTINTSMLYADSTAEMKILGKENEIPVASLDSKRTELGDDVIFHNGKGDTFVNLGNSESDEAMVMGNILISNSSDGSLLTSDLTAMDLTLDAKGDVVMAGDLYAFGDLNVIGKSVTNASNAMQAVGLVSVESTGGDIINRAEILSVEGNVTLSAKEGSIFNDSTGDIFAFGGNVTLSADAADATLEDGVRKGSVINRGDLLACTKDDSQDETDSGNIRLISQNADVYNYDDLNAIDGESEYDYSGNTYSTALSNIEMSAANGYLFTGQDELKAGGSITLTAKDGLGSIGNEIYAGRDISITATDGDIYNRTDIESMDGSVSIRAEKGTVVNTLTGNILAGGGNVELLAGGDAGHTDTGRQFYMVDAQSNVFVVTPDVSEDTDGLVVKTYKYYKSDSTGEYVKITDDTDVDAMSSAEKKSVASLAVYVDADGEDQDLTFSGAEEYVTINGKKAVLGDVEFFRSGDVLNRGNVVAMGQTEIIDDEIHSVVPGTIHLRSEHGDVVNYDNFQKWDGQDHEIIDPDMGYGYRRYMLSTGNISLEAPEGYFYNDFSFETAGDLTLSAKGDLVVGRDFSIADVGRDINIISTEGRVMNVSDTVLAAGRDLNIQAATGVESKGQLLAGRDVNLNTEIGDITSQGGVEAVNGSVNATTKSGDVNLAVVSAGNNVNILTEDGDIASEGGVEAVNGSVNATTKSGDINLSAVSAGNNVNILTEDGDITSEDLVEAVNGSVDVATKYGSINLAEVSAKDHVEVLSEDGGDVKAGNVKGDRVSVTAGGQDKAITLGNVTVGSYLKLHGDYINMPSKVQHGDSYKGVIHFDIAGGVENSMVKNDFALTNAGDSVFDMLHVTNAKIDITENGKFESDRIRVHGNVDISAMGSKTEILAEKPSASGFNYYYIDSGNWMNLYMIDGNHQKSSGILLHHDGKYYVENQRYSEENLARQFVGYKMAPDWTRYVSDPIMFFDRYNILENTLPSVSYAEDDEEFTIV